MSHSKGKSHAIPYKIISCSSENPKYTSSNLYSTIEEQEELMKSPLKKNVKKWESKEETTKVELMLALSMPTEIQSVLIGNANSALIEVLAGKKDQSKESFKPIVPVYNLISLNDTRLPLTEDLNSPNFKNFHIRCKNENSEKYDRIWVVLRHFRKTRIGLRTLILSSSRFAPTNLLTSPTPTPNENENKKRMIKREEGEDNRREIKGKEEKGKGKEEKKSPVRATLVVDYDDDDDGDDVHDADDLESPDLRPELPPPKNIIHNNNNRNNNNNNRSIDKSNRGDNNNNNEKNSRNKQVNKTESKTNEKNESTKGKTNTNGDGKTNLSSLLKGVVFAISGIPNPARDQFRSLGISLGASYEPDWGKKCTHLICHVPNNGKYLDAQKDGKIIISPAWFDQCKTTQKRLPEKAFLIKNLNDHSDQSDGDEKMDDGDGDPRNSPLPAKRKRKSLLDKQQLKYTLSLFGTKKGSDDDEWNGEEDDDVTATSPKRKKNKMNNTPTDYGDWGVSVEKAETSKSRGKSTKKRNDDDDEYDDIVDSLDEQNDDYEVDDDLIINDGDDDFDFSPVKNRTSSQPLNKSNQKKRSEEAKIKNEIMREEEEGSEGTEEMSDVEINQILKSKSRDRSPSPKSPTPRSNNNNKNIINNNNQHQNQNNIKKNREENTPKNNINNNDNIKAEFLNSKGPNKKLLDIFTGVRCYLHIANDKSLYNKLHRLIITYNGTVDTFIYDDTTHMVTNKEWDQSFSNLQNQMPSIHIVGPDWVSDCSKKQSLIDFYDYLIPDD